MTANEKGPLAELPRGALCVTASRARPQSAEATRCALRLQLRQRGGGGRLTHAAHHLVGQRDGDLLGQLGILLGQDAIALADDEVAPHAGGYASQHQKRLDVVEAAVQHERVRQVRADGTEDVERAFVTLVGQALHHLELLGGGRARGRVRCPRRGPA